MWAIKTLVVLALAIRRMEACSSLLMKQRTSSCRDLEYDPSVTFEYVIEVFKEC